MTDDISLASWFEDQKRAVEATYLASDDEYRQSGWTGTPEHWRASREVIVDAVTHDGDFLDIGSANGLLLDGLVAWAAEREITLTPHGIDFVPELVELARARFPEFSENFTVANAWHWQPARQYDFVHTLLDYVPREQQRAYLQRLLDEVVAPGGRLIVSSYGNRDENQRPLDIDLHLQLLGFQTAGCGNGRAGDGWVSTRTAWVNR